MSADTLQPHLPWIESHLPLPPVEKAWGEETEAPGLLAAGSDLGVERLLEGLCQRRISLVQRRPACAVVEPRSAHGAANQTLQTSPIFAKNLGSLFGTSSIRVVF